MEEKKIICGDYLYCIEDDGTACITAYRGKNGTDLIIPDQLDGHIVKWIDGFAFNTAMNDDAQAQPSGEADELIEEAGLDYYLDEFSYISPKSVTIPESVKDIGCQAFAGCLILESLVVKGDYVDLGEEAFVRCQALKSLIIYGDDVFINEAAFKDCYAIESIRIYGKRTIIGKSAFENCCSLVSVSLNDVLEIHEGAFRNCTSLATFELDSGIQILSEEAFDECTSLKSVSIGKGVRSAIRSRKLQIFR